MKTPRPLRVIEACTESVGVLATWLTLLMVLVGAGNALARYGGKFFGLALGSNALLELQWYLFTLVFFLGASYALKQDAHVRVDLLFSRASARTRAWIDLWGTILLLFPFCSVTLFVSWPSVRNSVMIGEGSPDPGGLLRWPIKLVILGALALLILQGLVQIAKAVAVLRDPRLTCDSDEKTTTAHGQKV
jgi:TRAP-type mannitol/chloroaromatic compound transport system permease small subunit